MKYPRLSRANPDRTGAAAIAADTVRSWELVQAQLAPIIGDSGFRVLFARSLHRARIEHSWLSREPGEADVPFSMLKASLESQAPKQAEDGSRALMTQFNELLTALIGKQLAARLLTNHGGRQARPRNLE